MAQITYFNGNRAFYAIDFNRYEFDDANDSDTLAILYWDASQAPYNPFVGAWRIELDLEGLEIHTFTEGPRAGEEDPIAGTITAARYYDSLGNLLMEVTGLTGDIPTISRLIDMERGMDAWNVMMQGNHVYTGSANSMADDWNGDEIITAGGNDTVNGLGGDDYIRDGGGRDSYFGGVGFDQVSYAEHWFWQNPAGAISGIRANLATGTITGPDGQRDTVNSIEGIRGTHLADRMTGDANNNTFFGLGGNDIIDGGAGFDTVRYDRDDRYFGLDGIVANLGTGRIRDGFGNTDRVKNVEAVRGTEQRDRIIDDNADNVLRGMGGNDLLVASGGNDTLRGDAGRDTFEFRGTAFGFDVITDFDQSANEKIKIAAASGLGDLTILQDGTDAIIRLNANSEIRLLGMDSSLLGSGDFLF